MNNEPRTMNQFMQNEANFTPPRLIFCVTNLLTYCVTNLLSYSFMQNKPNSTHKEYAIRHTQYAIRDKYAKRPQPKNYGQDARLAPRPTGHEIRATKKCKTNPISKIDSCTR